MAEIAPIRAVLFDPARVAVSSVIAPPYDVIGEEERARLEALDPHNSVRLILPRGDGDAKYATAASTWQAWRAEGILRRDERPAIYRYNQVFTSPELGPAPVTRRGLIAGVRLHRFDEGVIKPHERTLRGPKEDRQKLMRATRAHFSQIFMLYPDPARAADAALAAAEQNRPDLEGTTADGTLHQLWRVTDPAVLAAVGRVLDPLAFYIADGHHRYETMLALRDEFRAQAGGKVSPRATTEYATAFLANMDDPGLVVLPTHRLVHSLPSFDRAAVLDKAKAHFEVEALAGLAAPAEAQKLRAEIAKRAATRPAFALVVPGDTSAWILSLRSDPTSVGLPGAKALVSLDVSLLHGLVLERMLGVDRAAQEAQKNIDYVKDTRDALAKVQRATCQVGFIMHPTRVGQVQAVADAGEVMPQKSTFFYPKIASGLVMNPLDPAETLEPIGK
jgi:uncharacterized protein (DUF1015 family)